MSSRWGYLPCTLERPDLRPTAARVVDELLTTTLLAGTDHQRRPFVRRSCCLNYRIPGGGYCGDCILLTR